MWHVRVFQLNKDGAKLTKDTHDTMTSLKRVSPTQPPLPLSRWCFVRAVSLLLWHLLHFEAITGDYLARALSDRPHDTQAKENYYKLHKAADDAEAAYQKKKAEPAAKQKDVDKVHYRQPHRSNTRRTRHARN